MPWNQEGWPGSPKFREGCWNETAHSSVSVRVVFCHEAKNNSSFSIGFRMPNEEIAPARRSCKLPTNQEKADSPRRRRFWLALLAVQFGPNHWSNVQLRALKRHRSKEANTQQSPGFQRVSAGFRVEFLVLLRSNPPGSAGIRGNQWDRRPRKLKPRHVAGSSSPAERPRKSAARSGVFFSASSPRLKPNQLTNALRILHYKNRSTIVSMVLEV